jgi:hypothetical protein
VQIKKTVGVILVILFLLVAVHSVLAGSLTMTITGMGSTCNTFTLNFNYASVGTVNDAIGLDYLGIVVYDGDGTAIGWIQYFIGTGNMGGGSVTNLSLDGYVAVPDSLPFTLRIYDTTVPATDVATASAGPMTYFTTFDPTSYGLCTNLVSNPSVGSGGVLTPPDARINWRYGDLSAVLYRNVDEDGNPVIDVYCYNGERGVLDFQAGSGTRNRTQADDCNVTFYILGDGSFQFNILAPEGKEYTVICADFVCADPQLSYFDPNE